MIRNEPKPTPTQGPRLISMQEAAERVLYTPTHLYRLIRKNEFPRPLKLGDARIAFLETEIDGWIRKRAAQREGVAA
jgi:prophage regulatory protein